MRGATPIQSLTALHAPKKKKPRATAPFALFSRFLHWYTAAQGVLETAQANLEANGLEVRVACLEAQGLDHDLFRQAAPFDLILANILKGPLIALAPDLAAATAPGGRVILSGLLKEQVDEVAEVYARSSISELHRNEIGDWATLILAPKGAN